MIYLVEWPDGSKAVIRAAGEEQVRKIAVAWRKQNGDPPTPKSICNVHSKGPVQVILAGWGPA